MSFSGAPDGFVRVKEYQFRNLMRYAVKTQNGYPIWTSGLTIQQAEWLRDAINEKIAREKEADSDK